VDMIPDAEKVAYLEAVVSVPYLVRSECNFLHFLALEDYNCWVSHMKAGSCSIAAIRKLTNCMCSVQLGVLWDIGNIERKSLVNVGCYR
jgi:hypothetical protein